MSVSWLLPSTTTDIHKFDDATRYIVYGPSRSGKTALLVNFAKKASNMGHTILFLCSRSKIDMARGIQGGSRDSSEKMSSERVLFKYIESLSELLRYLSWAHMGSVTPSVIILDDISSLIGSAADSMGSLQKVLALLENLREHFAQKNSKGCLSMISCIQSSDIRAQMLAFDRCADCVCVSMPLEMNTFRLSVFRYFGVELEDGGNSIGLFTFENDQLSSTT